MGKLKLNLKKAIILGDYQRLERGEQVINSVRNLGRELAMTFPDRYDTDEVYERLDKARRYGTSDHQLIEDIEKLTEISFRTFTTEVMEESKMNSE